MTHRTMAFVTSVVEHHEGLIQQPITPRANSYHRATSRSHATMAAYSGMFLYVILTSNVRYVKCPNGSTDES